MSISSLVLEKRKRVPKVKSILEEIVDNINLPMLDIIINI